MNLSIFLENAKSNDEVLDRDWSGDSEVDGYFRKRTWWNPKKGFSKPATFRCLTAEGGEFVGFLAAAAANQPFPTDDGGEKARVLVIWAVGVDSSLHGKPNPLGQPGETFAASIFKSLESSPQLYLPDCVGMSLWVRNDNARAIAFYKKMGFQADPGGPKQRDPDGAPHLSLRKPRL